MKLMGYPTDSERTSWERMKIFLAGFALNIDQIPIGPFKNVSKSTFFQSVNYLQKLGLITLIKKKIGRYYIMESQILLSDESIVSGELRKRL